MSVKHYGIYLSSAPMVNMRHQGLGRYLASFLKGAAMHRDVLFIIICPSWSLEGLEELFLSEAVPRDSFKLVSPAGVPPVLMGYQAWQAYQRRPRRPSLLCSYIERANELKAVFAERTLQRVIRATSVLELVFALLPSGALAVAAFLLSPMLLVVGVLFRVSQLLRRVISRLIRPIGRLLVLVATSDDPAQGGRSGCPDVSGDGTGGE